MFERIKYNLKSLKSLCDNYFYDSIEDKEAKKILNEIIIKKFYNNYPELNGLIEKDYISFIERYKELRDKNETSRTTFDTFKIIENLEKDKILNYINENKSDEFFKNKAHKIMYNLQNKNIHLIDFYKDIYDYYMNSKHSNEFKLDRVYAIMELGNKDIIKQVKDEKLFKTIEYFVDELVDKKNISKNDIRLLKDINNKINNSIVSSKIITLYNNIDFEKINKNEYYSLLQEKNISKELFNNLINNYSLNKDNTKVVIKAIEQSNYKEDYTNTLEKLYLIRDEQNRINKEKRDNLNNVLLGVLLASSLASSNKEDDSSLLTSALEIGAGIVVGNAIENVVSDVFSNNSSNDFSGF